MSGCIIAATGWAAARTLLSDPAPKGRRQRRQSAQAQAPARWTRRRCPLLVRMTSDETRFGGREGRPQTRWQAPPPWHLTTLPRRRRSRARQTGGQEQGSGPRSPPSPQTQQFQRIRLSQVICYHYTTFTAADVSGWQDLCIAFVYSICISLYPICFYPCFIVFYLLLSLIRCTPIIVVIRIAIFIMTTTHIINTIALHIASTTVFYLHL